MNLNAVASNLTEVIGWIGTVISYLPWRADRLRRWRRPQSASCGDGSCQCPDGAWRGENIGDQKAILRGGKE